MTAATIDRHIVQTPGIVGGKPRIAGHRISVNDIVIWHERMGIGPEQISSEYKLDLAQIYAALAYYFDNREEIDRSIKDGEEFVEQLRKVTKSPLAEKLEKMKAIAGE